MAYRLHINITITGMLLFAGRFKYVRVRKKARIYTRAVNDQGNNGPVNLRQISQNCIQHNPIRNYERT